LSRWREPIQIAEATGLPAAAVAERLNDPQVERDHRGRVLGFGLTLIPTPHRIDLVDRGHTLYGWCGPDVLAIPWLLGIPRRITTRCPATGTPITVHVGPEGVGEIDPADAVVSFMPTLDPSDIRGSTCDRQHFFASRDAAAGWLAAHPHGVVVPAAVAFQAVTGAFDRAGWTHARIGAGGIT
jgi:alkylmercury lyase